MFEHSKQARRMMPGGVTVIGAFFVSSDPADTTFKSSKVCSEPCFKSPPRMKKNFPGFQGVDKCRQLFAQLKKNNDSAKEISLSDGLLLVHLQRKDQKISTRLLDPELKTSR